MPAGILFYSKQGFTGHEMATITEIRYLQNHVTLEISNGEKINIPVESVGILKLSKGAEIGADEYGLLKDESERYSCWRKSLDYLSVRARSIMEMERYLKRKGYSGDIINQVINRLTMHGYLNDYEFASAYVRGRIKRKAVGRDYLMRELIKKGVKKDVADSAIRDAGADRPDERRIYELAKKKYDSLREKPNPGSKLYYYLRQRGFSMRDIKPVVNRLLKEGGADPGEADSLEGSDE